MLISKPCDLIDEEVVAAVREDLTIEGTDSIVTDLKLPVKGTQGVEISWSSFNPDIVAPDGTVNRPAPGEGSISLILTVTITKGSVIDTKEF